MVLSYKKYKCCLTVTNITTVYYRRSFKIMATVLELHKILSQMCRWGVAVKFLAYIQQF